MKVLMTTEKLDSKDSIFAFSHLWIETMARQVDRLTVIALSVGSYDLPANVKVLHLGKEKYINKNIKQLLYLKNFYKYIWQERSNYDTVFVHMNQQNVILGSIVWKFLGKKIGLWYTHRQISLSLRLAVWLADVVFTAAEESMNVVTNKKNVMGHGIDTGKFVDENRKTVLEIQEGKSIKIISIGRITPIKDLVTLIKATKILVDKGMNIETRFIGPEVNNVDKAYKLELDELVNDLDLVNNIIFTGGKNPEEARKEIWEADISVNLCPTGGLDKAIIESICGGLHTFIANEAFRVHLGEYADIYNFIHSDEVDLANKIENLINKDKKISNVEIRDLQDKFIQKFDVKNLIKNILNVLLK
jgi:glycosyltransferase involved in cell wall biosynthesis